MNRMAKQLFERVNTPVTLEHDRVPFFLRDPTVSLPRSNNGKE